MKVRALANFFDIKEEVDRNVGDEFVVTPERAEAINNAGFGKLVEVIEFDEAAQEPKPKRK